MMIVNPYTYDPTLLGILTRLGLTGSLQLCLDAGDILSYASGQQWTDRSGNGNHFNRGTTSASEAADPTFNGTAGNLSESEYWSFDGGDLFQETAAQTFADGWMQDGSKFTLLSLVYPPSAGFSADCFIFSTRADEHAILCTSANKLAYAPFFTLGTSSNSFTGAAWNFAAVSYDENGGAAGSFLRLGSTVTTFNGNIGGSAASGANSVGSGNAHQIQNTTRMSMLAAWNGVNLTAAQISSIYDAIKAQRHSGI